jgi:hypothetical protein
LGPPRASAAQNCGVVDATRFLSEVFIGVPVLVHVFEAAGDEACPEHT